MYTMKYVSFTTKCALLIGVRAVDSSDDENYLVIMFNYTLVYYFILFFNAFVISPQGRVSVTYFHSLNCCFPWDKSAIIAVIF